MLKNNKGVSLVEMMIALVILLLVFLALMQVALISIDSNLKNLIRDEAVNIAEQRLSDLRNKPFDDTFLPTGSADETGIVRSFRGINITFTPNRTITNLSIDNKLIIIAVGWDWKGEHFTHTARTIKRRT